MEDLKNELRSMKASALERNLFDEVMTIKVILDKSEDQSEWVLLNSLSKLQSMKLSVKILEATMIGKSVSALRNHASKNVRDDVRMIIKQWRLVVDSWLNNSTKNNEPKGGTDDDDDSKNNQATHTSQQKRPMIIRIKLKNTQTEKESVPKGPVTPEQKVKNNGISSSTSSVYTSSNGIADVVLTIKGILEKSGDQTDELVFCDLLWKLQNMGLSVKDLESTGIGKTVNILKKHASKDVSQIATTLVDTWKAMVKELINKQSHVVTSSSKPTGLNMERKLQLNSGNTNITSSNIKEKVEVSKRKQHEGYKEIAASMERKPINVNRERKLEICSSSGSSIEEKLEATKRKLHTDYKEAENAKKRRRIQVMEFHELVNEGLLCPTAGRRQIKPLKKPIKRIWSNGCR